MDPKDEFVHPTGDHPAWSESYYFNFVDPEKLICLVTRMSFRANEGYADGLHIVFLGKDRILYSFDRRVIQPDDHELKVKNLRFERCEPFRRWNAHYDGRIMDLSDAAIMLVSEEQRPEGWSKKSPLNLLVTFEMPGDPHYTGTGQTGHFEQACAAEGKIKIGDTLLAVKGFGVRDKSWGPRDWKPMADGDAGDSKVLKSNSPSPFVQWFSMNFGPNLALGFVTLSSPEGAILHSIGWHHEGGKAQGIRDIKINSRYKPDSVQHIGAHITGIIEDGTPLELDCEVLNICPIAFPMAKDTTFVMEGFACFSLMEKQGYGIAEYWHTLKR